MSDRGAIGNSLWRYLPPEIITDILFRLPVKSLCRFKCVSPSWNFLISSRHFAKTHLNRANTNDPKHLNRKIILICLHHNLYSVNLTADVPITTKLGFPSLQQTENKWVKVLNSCNGLLLLSDEGNSNLWLLNPSTGQCKKLPTLPILDLIDGSLQYACGVSYDSSRDDYKVVMVSRKNRKLRLSESESSAESDTKIVLVYSLKTDTWRRIQDIHYIPRRKSFWVFLNGCLHAICQRNVSSLIVAFDLSDEIFREVPFPASLGSLSIVYHQLEVVADCLCLIDSKGAAYGRKAEFWMMKEYGVGESWTRFPIHPAMSRLHLLSLLAEDKSLMRTNHRIPRKRVVYNSKKEVRSCGIPPKFTFGDTYVESLISPHLGEE